MKASGALGRIAGVVALAAIVVVVVLLLLGGGGPKYQVTASFENASQLVNGNVVTIAGTNVGLVDEIELGDDGSALVTFNVDEEFAPLQRGTTAEVRSFSLSGQANRQIQLNLPAEGDGGPEIASGETLDQSETISEVDLDEIFNMLDDETVADFKKVIKGFAIAQGGSSAENLNEGFKYLNPFLSTSRQTFAELTLDQTALENLIVDGADLSGTLAARRDDLSALVGNLDVMMGAISSESDSLTKAVGDLPDFLRNFNTTSVNLRAALDDVDPLVEASKPVAKRLRPFFTQLRATSANLVPTTRDLDQILTRPGRNNDLVELTRLQPRLAQIAVETATRNGERRPGAFPEAATALGDSLNELAFFRAYSPELTGWFDDFGHSGITDANGGIGRIGTTFNTFSLAAPGIPNVNLSAPLAGANNEAELRTIYDNPETSGNYRRCPGSNERPAPDGSNPFLDSGNPARFGGPVNCDPSITPPG